MSSIHNLSRQDWEAVRAWMQRTTSHLTDDNITVDDESVKLRLREVAQLSVETFIQAIKEQTETPDD